MESIKIAFKKNNLSGIRGVLIFIIAIVTSSFFLYTGYFGSFPALTQRATLLILAFSLIFLHKPFVPEKKFLSGIVDSALIIINISVFIYIQLDRAAIGYRVGNPNIVDIIMAMGAVLVVIEATRRSAGLALPILAFVFAIYGYFGPYMPELIMHRGLNINNLTSCLYMGEEGIFGTPVAVASNFIMIYIIFGAFLQASGAGDFFTEISKAAFGWMRGGPAKVAVISSGLMGSISGSAVANVVTTGTFTIPLMKKTGYPSEVAGAVESVASTGGQIMPPIMGAAAFIMADFLQIPYWEVVKAAIIPAILYYIALFVIVDLEAAKNQLKGQLKSKLPSTKKILKRQGYLMLPVLVLIYLLGVVQYSPQKSAFWTIVFILIISAIKSESRIDIEKFLVAMVKGTMGGLQVAAVCACAGIVIGIIMRTGLGMALTGVLIEVSGGSLIVLMLLTMVTSIIMGMGLPTSACYIIVAVLIAPSMVSMGVLPIAAHLFAFYYACLSTITPPVALASYAAAGIAESNPMKTGFQGMRLGACGFIVPFMFVFGPCLLIQGSTIDIIVAFVSAALGTYALAIGLTGYQNIKVSIILRPLYIATALLLIYPGTLSDISGIIILAVLSLLNYKKRNIPDNRLGDILSSGKVE